MKRKSNKNDGLFNGIADEFFDLNNAAGTTEFTGMIPSGAQNEYDIHSYNGIMGYLPMGMNVKNSIDDFEDDTTVTTQGK